MKVCYVDETGTDGRSPVVVMVGIIVDGQRLRRTRADFLDVFTRMGELSEKSFRELKAVDLYRGNGPWRGVEGEARHNAIADLCQWLCRRKHSLALAAIDRERYAQGSLDDGLDEWLSAALHIALQVQKAHQAIKSSKGATFMVFDEQRHAGDLAELLFNPPPWTDGYYSRTTRKERLDQVIDTAFYARSHHVGLVQVADLFAFLFRRYAELTDYGRREEYAGEHARLSEWVGTLSTRLLPVAHRWQKRTSNPPALWFTDMAPSSLRALG
jgi:hypothetical protein